MLLRKSGWPRVGEHTVWLPLCAESEQTWYEALHPLSLGACLRQLLLALARYLAYRCCYCFWGVCQGNQ